MGLLRLNKLILLCLVLMSYQVAAQEVIDNVSIEKTGNSLYRIKYSLTAKEELQIQSVILKIYRRRNQQVEEIFSATITPTVASLKGKKLYSYNWMTGTETVKTGDELQAKIQLVYQPPAIVRSTKTNIPPRADAGEFLTIETPVTKAILLNGRKSVDDDGRIRSYQWKQIAGPTTLRIASKDSAATFLTGEFVPGTYAFEITVTDDKGASSVGRTIVSVKSGMPAVAPNAGVTGVKKDTVRSAPKQSPKPVVASVKTRTKLKGGPLNTAINLVVPGLGHYYVSGDYNGNNRKPMVFGITALYAGAIGGAFGGHQRGAW